jgi:hypothetical protein
MTPGASPATHDMTGRAARRRVVLKSFGAIVAMRPSRCLLARGRARGLPLIQMCAWVTTMEDRQVVHRPKYLDHVEALGVVGLPDQAMSQEDFEDVRLEAKQLVGGDQALDVCDVNEGHRARTRSPLMRATAGGPRGASGRAASRRLRAPRAR